MKLLQKSNKLLTAFLILLFIFNIIQGYNTELLADEAYYWMYSNFLDWGYFDHPPMVAVWISISKLFFSSGELSVRFFSAITLSITFYLVWLLIDHPKKKENTWLFILITLTTSLFNVYGFITVPDTPLMFFMAIFLLGYKKYLKEKSFISYLILVLSISGMMYSKYQAVLIVFFVLLSNLKALKDYKIWIMTASIILLYFPHLYWQYINDYPSFKYHLFERKENTIYRFRDTYMHILNTMAIIGLTFPLVYKSLFRNLKNKDLFQKALNFTAVGFIVFFFISTFKGHAQAQWIVPISIPLIIIPFNYIINNPKHKKTFIILASITLVISSFLRFSMAGNSLFGKQFEMHGNKKWVMELSEKLGDKEALFLNSYQSTSWYWFYSGKRPYQYNAFYRRKNHYDLLDYNKNANVGEITLLAGRTNSVYDSVPTRNGGKIFLTKLDSYKKESINIEPIETPTLKEAALNTFKIVLKNPNNIDLKTLKLQVILKDKDKISLKTETLKDHPTSAQVFNAKLKSEYLEFTIPDFKTKFTPAYIQVIGRANKKTQSVRVGIFKCNYHNE